MTTMKDGKLKIALQRAGLKLKQSDENQKFAFYMLFNVKTRESILFIDSRPDKNPRRFCSPELIDQHLKKTGLHRSGLGKDLKPLRSCAGEVQFSKTGRGEGCFHFNITSRVGKATPSMLKLAIQKDPVTKKIIKGWSFDPPGQLGKKKARDLQVRKAFWEARDKYWAKQRSSARTHLGREGSSSRSEYSIRGLFKQLVIDIEQISQDIQVLEDDINYLEDRNRPQAVCALERYCETFIAHRAEFSRWKQEVISAEKSVSISAADIEPLTFEDIEQEQAITIELRTGERLEQEWAGFAGERKNQPDLQEDKAEFFALYRADREREIAEEVKAEYQAELSLQLEASLAALESEEAFQIAREEELAIEVDELMADLTATPLPGATRRRLFEVSSAAFQLDSPEQHLKQLRGALKDKSAIKQIDVLIADAGACRKSTSVPPSEPLYRSIQDFAQGQEKPSEFSRRIPRFCYLFRGGKLAARAAGSLSHALKRGDKEAVAQLKETYQGIGAEVADFEQGVSLLLGSRYISSSMTLGGQHLQESGEFGPMLAGLLVIYAEASPRIDSKGKKTALKVIDGIEQGYELYTQASEAYEALKEWAEWLESPEYKREGSIGIGEQISWESRVFEKTVDYGDLSARADLQLSAKAAAECSASGSFTITGSKIRLEGEIKLGAVAEATIRSNPSLGYKGKQLFAANLEATASIGAGVTASGSITFKNGKFRVRMRGSGTFGVGVGTNSEIEIDYKALGQALLEKEFYKQTMGAIGVAIKGALTWVFDQLKLLYDSATLENIQALPGKTLATCFPTFYEAHSLSEVFDAATSKRIKGKLKRDNERCRLAG